MRVVLPFLLFFVCSTATADEWRYQVVPYIW